MFLLLLAAARAYESEPSDLVFTDRYDLLDGVGYDSGFVPSGSPIMVRIYLESAGGIDTEMAATSTVTWPGALTHHVDPTPGTGWFSMVTEFVLGADVKFDVWGYTATTTVWSDRLRIAAESAFEPLLLPDGTPSRVDVSGDGGGIDPVSYSFAIFSGVTLQFELNAWPRANASLAGQRLETTGPETTSWIERAGQTGHFDVPAEDPGDLPLSSVYVGWLNADLQFVFEPSAAVCVAILGCIDLVDFEIPVTLLSASEERRFEPVVYEHPLPVLDVPFANHDFGGIEPGDLANLEVPLGNLGLLDVEGTAWVEGDAAFSVFPSYFQAAEDATDGVMVTWAPTIEGDQTAVLVLESNDPGRPRIEIPLLGRAESPETTDTDDGEGISMPVKQCGCATPAAPALSPALLVAGWLLTRRRTRLS